MAAPLAPRKAAVLLVNLGSPQTATRRGVAEFLRPFLLDRRVVELPRWLWWPLLNGVIIPLRAGRAARAYRGIWTASGSPLRTYTARLAARLQAELSGSDLPVRVAWAMTYGKPEIAATLHDLQREGAETIVVLPLFPQYSATTTGAVYDQVAEFVQSVRNIPRLHLIRHYPALPEYIAALADSVRAHWQAHGRADRLVMSFHGIPQRCADLGDPYPRDCELTARLLSAALGLAADEWTLTYQSRFGRLQWLQPYTDATLEEWAQSGIATVDVICPAFATDCLETLEEIAVDNRERFRAAGGQELRLIPCLNDDARHVSALRALVHDNL